MKKILIFTFLVVGFTAHSQIKLKATIGWDKVIEVEEKSYVVKAKLPQRVWEDLYYNGYRMHRIKASESGTIVIGMYNSEGDEYFYIITDNEKLLSIRNRFVIRPVWYKVYKK